jgi:hypothetical protein
MKAKLLLATVLLCVGIGGCQCSDKPDVGPVEEPSQTQVD